MMVSWVWVSGWVEARMGLFQATRGWVGVGLRLGLGIWADKKYRKSLESLATSALSRWFCNHRRFCWTGVHDGGGMSFGFWVEARMGLF